jgi:hypothetical protein
MWAPEAAGRGGLRSACVITCATTMLCSAASGAIACATTVALLRWICMVIRPEWHGSAWLPSAITIRMTFLFLHSPPSQPQVINRRP